MEELTKLFSLEELLTYADDDFEGESNEKIEIVRNTLFVDESQADVIYTMILIEVLENGVSWMRAVDILNEGEVDIESLIMYEDEVCIFETFKYIPFTELGSCKLSTLYTDKSIFISRQDVSEEEEKDMSKMADKYIVSKMKTTLN